MLKTQQHDFEHESDFLPAEQNSSSAHDKLVVRADDGGPLEAVVNQLSQKMTAVEADVQALKNSDQLLHTFMTTVQHQLQNDLSTAEQQLQAVNQQQDANIQALKN
jgi:hypothetical protein